MPYKGGYNGGWGDWGDRQKGQARGWQQGWNQRGHGQNSHGQYGQGHYGHGQHGHGQFAHGAGHGQYGNGPYSNGQYDNGQYDDGGGGDGGGCRAKLAPWRGKRPAPWSDSGAGADYNGDNAHKATASRPYSWRQPRRRWDSAPSNASGVAEESEQSQGQPAKSVVLQRKSLQLRREELGIVVTGEPDERNIPPIADFCELAHQLPDYLIKALNAEGLSTPMAIQAQALPLALAGFDLVGIAKTGSGKTLAFLLPAIAHIETQDVLTEDQCSPVALVMAPVRELAIQIAEEANKLLGNSGSRRHPRGIGAVCIYGGGARVRWQQIHELQRGWCQMVVATPGRAVDLMDAKEMSLDRVGYFVLDEADRMLDSGFGEQLSAISSTIRQDRQTLFFSATWPSEVQNLAAEMCRGALIQVSVGQAEDGSDGPAARDDILQEVVVVDNGNWEDHENYKQEHLYRHLRTILHNDSFKVLVFVNMKSLAWELAGKLGEEGFTADFMYGGRSQDSRQEIVNKFKSGNIKLLVTTDVMARGLDIPGISHVVIYDCYGDIEEYVHRIGRTARGPYGKGHALTFYEYDPKYPDMPGQLIGVLEQAGQKVPEELRRIYDEVENGQRHVKWRRTSSSQG